MYALCLFQSSLRCKVNNSTQYHLDSRVTAPTRTFSMVPYCTLITLVTFYHREGTDGSSFKLYTEWLRSSVPLLCECARAHCVTRATHELHTTPCTATCNMQIHTVGNSTCAHFTLPCIVILNLMSSIPKCSQNI
jgi:hypothetical protein